MSDDTSRHVRVSHLYDELLYYMQQCYYQRSPVQVAHLPLTVESSLVLVLYVSGTTCQLIWTLQILSFFVHAINRINFTIYCDFNVCSDSVLLLHVPTLCSSFTDLRKSIYIPCSFRQSMDADNPVVILYYAQAYCITWFLQIK